AFGAVVTLILVSLVSKETRLSPYNFVKALAAGASQAAILCVACAVIGPIIETVSFTGLEIKLPSMPTD
ncbi:C4-dicarboxylate ABC transporter permease, partial [Chloroflexota bacterium]